MANAMAGTMDPALAAALRVKEAKAKAKAHARASATSAMSGATATSATSAMSGGAAATSATSGTVAPGKFLLLILLRGAAFRHGSRTSSRDRLTAYNAVNPASGEQLVALKSLQQNVVVPATAIGWRVGLAIDVVLPPQLHGAWQQVKSASGLHAAAIERLSENLRASSQSESFANSLEWASRTLAAEGAARSAVLITRVDLVLRRPLPLPAPPDVPGKLIMPFREIKAKSREGRQGYGRCLVSWSDPIIYVPRCRTALDCARLRSIELDGHFLCLWVYHALPSMTSLMHYSPLMTSLIRSFGSHVLTALRDPLQSDCR